MRFRRELIDGKFLRAVRSRLLDLLARYNHAFPCDAIFENVPRPDGPGDLCGPSPFPGRGRWKGRTTASALPPGGRHGCFRFWLATKRGKLGNGSERLRAGGLGNRLQPVYRPNALVPGASAGRGFSVKMQSKPAFQVGPRLPGGT